MILQLTERESDLLRDLLEKHDLRHSLYERQDLIERLLERIGARAA